ncbi:hypothetical protein BH10PSE3_BH10PSE3_16640 [soil metagenome]
MGRAHRPWRPEGWPGNEIAWGLHPGFHGKGYAVEAATAALDWAVEVLGWTQVVHCIDPANAPSIKVAQRIGSRFLGPGRMPEPYQDAEIHLWGQSADEWKARRNA